MRRPSPAEGLGSCKRGLGVTSGLKADLGQVVPEMVDVVGSKEPEGNGRVGLDAAHLVLCIVRDVRDDMGKVPIVGRPELDEIAPGARVVVLHLDPVILGVAWKVKVARLLRSDEALVVIRCRVDEVAEHLFW